MPRRLEHVWVGHLSRPGSSGPVRLCRQLDYWAAGAGIFPFCGPLKQSADTQARSAVLLPRRRAAGALACSGRHVLARVGDLSGGKGCGAERGPGSRAGTRERSQLFKTRSGLAGNAAEPGK
ncbi:unnamed protein product [Boreogadus saida]